jgi:hypothetical protein
LNLAEKPFLSRVKHQNQILMRNVSHHMAVPAWFSFRWCHWLTLAVCLSLPALVSGQSPKSADPKLVPAIPRVVIPKLRGKIKIDGDLNERVWTNAALLKLSQNDGSGPEREQTEVRLWYDDTALYLGWICTDSDIQATFTNRDSHFWDEEVVEFFVTPKELKRYFELQWNPLGGVYDSTVDNEMDERGVSHNYKGDVSFSAKGMKSAVKVKGTVGNSSDKDEFWQVEVMIPFAALGQPTPKPKEVWRANFYRFNREKDRPVELLSWSPTMVPDFHQPSRFGYLEFGP